MDYHYVDYHYEPVMDSEEEEQLYAAIIPTGKVSQQGF